MPRCRLNFRPVFRSLRPNYRAMVYTNHSARLSIASNRMLGFTSCLRGPAIDSPGNRYNTVCKCFPVGLRCPVGPPQHQWPIASCPTRAAYQPIGNGGCDMCCAQFPAMSALHSGLSHMQQCYSGFIHQRGRRDQVFSIGSSHYQTSEYCSRMNFVIIPIHIRAFAM